LLPARRGKPARDGRSYSLREAPTPATRNSRRQSPRLAAALDDRVGEAGECLFHRPVRERCEGGNGLGSPAMCFGEGTARDIVRAQLRNRIVQVVFVPILAVRDTHI